VKDGDTILVLRNGELLEFKQKNPTQPSAGTNVVT
jgi:hypothetical protein